MGYGRLNAYKAVLAAANSGSHTISADLTFYETIALNSGLSITIPNGRTIGISSGATLTFNGSVTIPDNATVTFSGGGAVKFAGTVTIGTGATVTFSGPLYVDGSTTVGSGTTLVTSEADVMVPGTLTLNGTQNSPISMRFPTGGTLYIGPSGASTGNLYATYTHFYDPSNPNDPSWLGIRKETNSGTIQLTNCEVEDAWRAGLFVAASSVGPTVQVSNCRFHNCDSSGVIIWRANSSSYLRGVKIYNSKWAEGLRLMNTAMEVGKYVYPNPLTYDSIYTNRGGVYAKNFTGHMQYNRVNDNDVRVGQYDYSMYDNVTIDGSSPTISYNTFCNTGTPTNYERNDLRLIGSSPYMTNNWLYGGGDSEIYVTNGSYPTMTVYDIGDNGIHTYEYDNGGDPVSGTADHAIEWGTSNFGSTIWALSNWWGKASPTSEDWDHIFTQEDYVDHSEQRGTPPDQYPSKPARRAQAELSPDHAAMRDGLSAELAQNYGTALASYERLVAELPSSPLVHDALERIFSTMTKMGKEQSEVESYFAEQAARSDALNGLALQTAKEIRRRTMVFYGDLERATVAYRAVAENENEPSYDRRMAWYNLAWIADERKDKALLAEAVGHVLADTTDDAVAEIAIREWGSKVAITNPQAETVANASAGLLSAEPNPFNPSTTITYRVDAAGAVRVGIYAVSGQLIRTLVNETREPGTHAIVWDGDDASGRSVASGVYLVRLTTPTQSATHRVTMVR